MDGDSWSSRLFSSSKQRYQSRSGIKWDGFESEMLMEIEMDDDDATTEEDEYGCPFCTHKFDILSLCCHIDHQHPLHQKNAVCPVCSMRVGVDMVAHLTLQHANIFKMQRKRKSRRAGSHSTISLLRRELREGNLQSLLGGSSRMVSSTNAAPDPLLSSFMFPISDEFGSGQARSFSESTSVKKSINETVPYRKVQQAPLSIKDQEENEKRSEFVQRLLLFTIFDDDKL